MTGLRLTDQAEADLDGLWAHIAADNGQEAADRMVDAILASGRLHVRFPGMGQNRSELGSNIRSFVVSPFVAFYRAEDEELIVLRILHGARDIRSLAD